MLVIKFCDKLRRKITYTFLINKTFGQEMHKKAQINTNYSLTIRIQLCNI